MHDDDIEPDATVPRYVSPEPTVEALEHEREGYVKAGKTDRAKLVNEQLKAVKSRAGRRTAATRTEPTE